MATPPDRTILGYQAAVAEIRKRLGVYAATVWTSMPAYRDADVERLVRLLTPRVAAGQMQTARLTDAYLASLAGARAAGVDRRLVSGAGPRSVDPAEVYRRPAVTVYTALARGVAFDKAVAQGATRLQSIVSTDLQLAKRVQQQATLGSAGIERYRRVLTGAEDCSLCAVASEQTYTTGDLLPIHPSCDCDVAPDSDDVRSMNAANRDRLAERVTAELEQRGGEQGIEISDAQSLITNHEHGEYGPTLAWSADRFTGPGDL